MIIWEIFEDESCILDEIIGGEILNLIEKVRTCSANQKNVS
jgi:hypothetical protein